MPSLLQSISSFFSPPSSRQHSHIRRDQAMSSIDDAFSVPPGKSSVCSPVSMITPRSHYVLHTDTEYVSTPSVYTYPPQAQGGSYDTVPQQSYDHHRPPLSAASTSSSKARSSSLLPIYHTPLAPYPQYPPLQQTWARLRAWLDDQYPELADTLNWGLPPPELAQLELELGFALPQAVRESYLLVDGQEAESAAGCAEGLFFGLTLLPFEDVVDEWRFWRAVDDDPATGANPALRAAMRSIPPGWIRREYSQRGWLPLVADKAGNYIGVDMNPDERGAVGQVIVFGRDFDTKVVLWRGDGESGWARWLASFVDELESGEGFEVGATSDGSEGDEDDVGYESYFFDGTAGKGDGGGDGSGGGLRLTGEYRGWPVLEALADRSMKRWIEAGVMTAPTPTHSSSPNTVELRLEQAAETISAKGDDKSTHHVQANGDPSRSYVAQPPTKPPAPRPVDVPTEHDLITSPMLSPIEAALVYDHDDEADLPMREVDRTTPVQANFAPEAPLVPFPDVEIPPPTTSRQQADPLVNKSHSLLGEGPAPEASTGAVNTTTASTAASSEVLSLSILTLTSADPLEPQPEEPPEEKEESPQPTVRLVGGGGISSLVDGVSDSDKKSTAASVRRAEAA